MGWGEAVSLGDALGEVLWKGGCLLTDLSRHNLGNAEVRYCHSWTVSSAHHS